MTRWLYKLHARLFGYFWLPCPLCGRYYSGFEVKDWVRGVPKDSEVYMGTLCCPRCQHDAGMITGLHRNARYYVTPRVAKYMGERPEQFPNRQETSQ